MKIVHTVDKTLTIVLSGTPYGSDRAAAALGIAEAALDVGHTVNLFASSDGTYSALSGQSAAGLADIEDRLGSLIDRGLNVELCGSCLHFRGISKDRIVEGASPSTLRGLGNLVRDANVVLSL